MPGTVVLDSTNLDAIIADATGGPQEAQEKPAEPAKSEEGAKQEGEAVAAPEASEAVEEDENGLTEAQKRELTKKMQTAIGKKHRALKEAEEFAAEQYNERRLAESRAEQYEQEIARLKAQLEPKVELQKTDRPKRESFETQEAYEDAVADWKYAQRRAEEKAQEERVAAERRQVQILEQAKARITRALEIVPDYQEVLEAAELPVPAHIAGYMQESELFAELGYHFAKHPDELRRLQELSQARALVEIGKIESKLQPFAPSTGAKASNGDKPSPSDGAKPSTETGVSPAAATPSKPRAPAPITPISASSGRQVEKDEREMTAQEALAAWQKRRQVNLTRRQRH